MSADGWTICEVCGGQFVDLQEASCATGERGIIKSLVPAPETGICRLCKEVAYARAVLEEKRRREGQP